MNKFISFILSAILFYAPLCVYGNDLFKLTGKFDQGIDGTNIMLFTFRDNKIHTVDTTQIRNASFTFEGKEFLDDFSIITYGNYPDRVWSSDVILERGDIFVEIGEENIVRGTPLNESYQSYKKRDRYFSKKRHELATLHVEDSKKDSLKEVQNQNFKDWQHYVAEFARNNISNLIGRYAFVDNVVLFTQEDYFSIRNLLGEEAKQNLDIKDAIELRSQEDKFISEREKSLNQKIVDIVLIDINGNRKHILDIVNESEYLYIDFWASWCNPCIAEIPHLKKIYEEYRDRGFGLIGISIDTSEASWKSALRKIDVPWVNLMDMTGGKESMAKYKFRGVPYGILINKDGQIIKTGLRGEELESLLQQLVE